MRKIKIYDLPTRIFHWLFAIGFVAAFSIVKLVDDESIVYAFHMLIGLFIASLVIGRLIWGFFGGKHSRFVNFALNPVELLKYLTKAFSSKNKRYAGHNPGSSWAAIAMMICSIGLAATGLAIVNGGDKATIEDYHELFADGFFIIAIAHILGIVLHTFVHKEIIGLAMVNGKKEVPDTEEPQESYTKAGFIYLAFAVWMALTLYRGFDQTDGHLRVFGTDVQLFEVEDL